MILKRFFLKIIVIVPAIVLLSACFVVAELAKIESIHLENNPYAVRIKLSAKVPYKVVQFDKKEVLVAVKNTEVRNLGKLKGDGRPNIIDVQISPKRKGVISLVISANNNILSVSSVWSVKEKTLIVKPLFKKSSGIKKKSVSVRKYQHKPLIIKTEIIPKSSAEQIEQQEVFVGSATTELDHKIDKSGFTQGGRIFDKRFSGTTADLFLELRSDACADGSGEIRSGVLLCSQGAWDSALEIFDNFIDDDTLSNRCLENIYILRAYSFLKSIGKGSAREYIEAAEHFQDMISSFPDSI